MSNDHISAFADRRENGFRMEFLTSDFYAGSSLIKTISLKTKSSPPERDLTPDILNHNDFAAGYGLDRIPSGLDFKALLSGS